MRPEDLQSLDVIVESSRDQRTLDYLISVCGLKRVKRARQQIPGQTRPYVSNLAKILGVTIPIEVLATPRQEAQRQISELKDKLAKGKWK
ncbi:MULTISPECIES: hypothetical protein [unclassified Caballeronia]|uniref:hypothetical protein n=1 Tax=unclassified Caballeronia TaxID=2646786 RepID=UPI00202847B3|nr:MULTISPECIES: hypothetical protein [unclassified Caballeronia]MDR5765829.1 hypothetical protein [Caballeronia sp. LZ028]